MRLKRQTGVIGRGLRVLKLNNFSVANLFNKNKKHAMVSFPIGDGRGS